MEPDFWFDRWQRGLIGFHLPFPNTNMLKHWPDLGAKPSGRVLVPLCGKTVDILWLLGRGHSVVGVELSAIALESLCLENGILARRRSGHIQSYDAPNLQLLCGNFLEMGSAQIGRFDAVYDRGALVSFADEPRRNYVTHLTRLAEPGTVVMLVTVEYPANQRPGPPFSVTSADIQNLYGSDFLIQELSRCDVLSDEPRMKERGVTSLHEVSYRLLRL